MKNFVRRAMPLSTRLCPFTSALSGRLTPARVAAPADTVRSRERRAECKIRIGSSNDVWLFGERPAESLAESAATPPGFPPYLPTMAEHVKTDAELVASTLRGSQDAFRELVVRFERPVYSLVQRMVQDPATAEDLAQEVFVKAFRALRSYDPRWKFSSWLFKIAHNTTIDHLRRGAPETVPLEGGEDDEGRGGLAAVLADQSVEDPGAGA